MELDVESDGLVTNHNLMRTLRNEFNDVIKEAEYMLVYSSYKYDYLPIGIKKTL